MPRIKITGKGLPKAEYMNSQVGEPNFKKIEFTPTLGLTSTKLKNGFAPFSLTTGTTTQSFNAIKDLNIPDCGEGATWDPIQKKCKPKQGYTELNNSVTGKTSFIKTGISYNPQNEALRQTTTTTTKNPMSFFNKAGNLLNKAAGVTDKIIGAASIISPAIDILDPLGRKQKAERKRNINMGVADATGLVNERDRGFWDPNTGASQPNKQPPVNWGMGSGQFLGTSSYQTAKEGGEVSMKIKIKSVPQGEQMAYGGQARHALDLRRDALVTPNITQKNNYDVKQVLKPVPEEYANLEAEKNETAYGDLDGDGNLEHMVIGGKRHSEGGTPLSLPNGTFIFSDTKKMRIKDPEVLAYFGLKAKSGGYTPAEIAKRYDINKYKALMEDPLADPLNKDTAQLMVKNYNKKLGYLAIVQESMKGFPQGIPEVAKQVMSEEEMAQFGGVVNSDKEEEFMPSAAYGGDLIKADYGLSLNPTTTTTTQQIVAGDPANTTAASSGNTGSSTPVSTTVNPSRVNYNNLLSQFNYIARQKDKLDYNTPEQASKINPIWDRNNYEKTWKPLVKETMSNPQFAADVIKYLENYPGKNAPAIKQILNQAKASGKTNEEIIRLATDYKVGPFHSAMYEAINTIPKDDPPPTTTTTTVKVEQPYSPPGTIGETTPPRKVNKGWYAPDKWNFLAAGVAGPKKYEKDVFDPNFAQSPYALQDWRARVAARQSTFNKLGETMGAYGPTQGLASNLSFAAGQTAEGAAQDIANVSAENVNIFNQRMAQDLARRDQYNQLIAQNKGLRLAVRSDADKEFRNDMRQYYNNLATAGTRGFTNMMYGNLVDAVNPRYNVNRRSGAVTYMGGRSANQLPSYNTGAPDWDNLLKQYTAAKGGSDLSFETFLKYQQPATAQRNTDDQALDMYRRALGFG
jgi:hypothetical protein